MKDTTSLGSLLRGKKKVVVDFDFSLGKKKPKMCTITHRHPDKGKYKVSTIIITNLNAKVHICA